MYKGDLFLPYFFYKNFQKTLAFFSFMYYNIITLKERNDKYVYKR